MIIKKLSTSKYCFGIILLVLFSFIFSLSSCSTTENYTVKEPNTIKQEGVIDVDKVTLRDSTVYKFNDEEKASYKKKYKNTSEVIIFNSKKDITDSNVRKISRDKYLLLLKDLSSIQYKRTYITATDALLTIGIVVVSIGLLLYIGLALALTSGKVNIAG
jgi:hypothetical protein